MPKSLCGRLKRSMLAMKRKYGEEIKKENAVAFKYSPRYAKMQKTNPSIPLAEF